MREYQRICIRAAFWFSKTHIFLFSNIFRTHTHVRTHFYFRSFKTAFGIGGSTANAELELKTRGLQHPILERVCITLHHMWVLVLCSGFGTFSILKSLAFFFAATCSSGFFLAIVFGLGHNGMATYSAETRPDFWKLQVTTTRNITKGHGGEFRKYT